MRAIGLTCGIGSMLVGARMAGFDVVGNVEWRNYYRKKDAAGRNTFTENFPGAFLKRSVDDLTHDEIERFMGVELAMGHPECGSYSTMNGTNAWRSENYQAERLADPGDIPLFTKLVARLKPRFFTMDDLPKSLGAYPMSAYAEALPDYDLFPEWISNHGYGNVQLYRKRMFMIGARKEERFAFVPGEFAHSRSVEDVIGDLPLEPAEVIAARGNLLPNHDPHNLSNECGRGLHMRRLWDRPSWQEMRDRFARMKEGEQFTYHSPNGGVKKKPGWYKARWHGHSPVLDGGSGHIHPIRNLPFTIRERARIQGFPDDFVFYGVRVEADGTWQHEKNIDLIKQTGKAMPIEFNRYCAMLVRHHIEGTAFPEATNSRVLDPNPYVDEAKTWYCSNVGYAEQARACGSCWLYARCRIRTEKYGIGPQALSSDDGRKRTTSRVATAIPSSQDADQPEAGSAREAPAVLLDSATSSDSSPAGRPSAAPATQVPDGAQHGGTGVSPASKSAPRSRPERAVKPTARDITFKKAVSNL